MENKETLEEVAEKSAIEQMEAGNSAYILGFTKGAKWKQEQDNNKFSEEEVIKFLQQYRYDLSSNKTANLGDTTGLWFEQFKKK